MTEKLKRSLPILLLTAGHGAVDFYVGLLAVIAPGLAQYLEIPIGDIILLIGVAALLNYIFQPVTGYLMGRRNMAWVMWFAVLLSSLPVFMGFATGLWSLAVLVILGAVGTGMYHPEAALTAHDVSGDRAYLGVPLFMAGGACVYAIGTPVSIRISEVFGYQALAWLLLPGIAVSAALFFQHQLKKRRHPSQMIRPRSKRMTTVQQGSLSYWPLLAVAICFGVVNGVFLSLLSTHYEMVFGPGARGWAGWILMVMGASGSLFSFAWSSLARKHGFYKMTLLTQLVACPLFVLMAYPPTPLAGFLIALPLSVFSPNAMYPVSVPLARNAAGLTQTMRTSILMGGTSGLSSIAVMLSGALLRREMPTSYMILFVAFCSFLAIVLSIWQMAAGRGRAAA